VLLEDLLGLEEVLMLLTNKLVQDPCSLDHLGLLLLMIHQLDHLMIFLGLLIILARVHLVTLSDGDQILRLKLISGILHHRRKLGWLERELVL